MVGGWLESERSDRLWLQPSLGQAEQYFCYLGAHVKFWNPRTNFQITPQVCLNIAECGGKGDPHQLMLHSSSCQYFRVLETNFIESNQLGWVEPHSRFHQWFPIIYPYEILVLFLRHKSRPNQICVRFEFRLLSNSTFNIWIHLSLDVFFIKLWFGQLG